ncbi:efflux RND transporter periplasmic adaptor subunit [Shewanella sedimentimangrovi]|uniref:Efflux RND transporter periplasmic adaptor subunit n=2 Tax=Shewanella sedimentimangrovi TaxID=2814293 RepID=A0ABX7QWT3_9GAMM|nr:efflux RND transporter periplasmic adaptor subunit [Shewanella sedimentimangrovi]QSX35967.1 efflux RND transporter periplasmic adaptor subunit [Shewanella sedimentimangrovi]
MKANSLLLTLLAQSTLTLGAWTLSALPTSMAAYAAEPQTQILKAEVHPQYLTLDAVIEPVRAATVSAQTSGRIIKLNFDVNDKVPAGAALLEITSKEQGAGLAAAEAELAKAQAVNIEAQAQLKRVSELFPKGAVSRNSMDEAIARARSTEQAVTAAKAGLTRARESLNYTVVYAPFSGVLTARHVEVGETVNPGQPLLSGYGSDAMRAVFSLPQQWVSAFRGNAKVELQLADGSKIDSDRIELFDFASAGGHSQRVRVALPEHAAVTPGSWAKVRFIKEMRSQLRIPKSALIVRNELNAVYLKQADAFVLTQVRLGQEQGDELTVLSGLAEGDEIALNAHQVTAR